MPGDCPASLCPPCVRLWKTFRSKPNAILVDDNNCSPSHRNRVHLRPDSPFHPSLAQCWLAPTPDASIGRVAARLPEARWRVTLRTT